MHGTKSRVDFVQKQALAVVRRNGPITPTDPNDVRSKKPSPKLQDIIKRKLELDEESGL